MRPARRNEVPTFGSVWRWGNHEDDCASYYVALSTRTTASGMVMLQTVRVNKFGVEFSDDTMAWGYQPKDGSIVASPGWFCVDEAP